MRPTVWLVPSFVIAMVSVLCMTFASFAEPPSGSKNKPIPKEKKKEFSPTENLDITNRVSVEDARERAKLAHNIFSATLDVVHHRYFRDDRSAVPAKALEEVFSEIAQQENLQARWIAVNAKAMSINHKPQDEFEKQAAKEIAAGKHEFERVENGVYRRAVGISLMNRGCLGCHMGFGASGKIKRFAGLVITIPVKQD